MQNKNEKNISPIKERVLQYIDYKGFQRKNFFSQIGVSPANFRGAAAGSDLSGVIVSAILKAHPDINAEWLMTGNGSMLADDYERKNTNVVNEDVLPYGNKAFAPLVSSLAVAGFNHSVFSVNDRDVIERYYVPDFGRVDFLIRVTGSSMVPTYKSGDIIACRIILNSTYIQWGRCYILSTHSQGIIIKRLMDGGNDTYVAKSDNIELFPPFNIPKDDVIGIAIVVGCISLE